MATLKKSEIEKIVDKVKDLTADLNGLSRAGEDGMESLQAIIAFEELQRHLEKLEQWAERVRSSELMYSLIKHS